MKRETKEKIKGKLYSIGREIEEWIIPITLGAGIGVGVYSYFAGIANSIQIKKLKNETARLNDNVAKLYQNQKQFTEWGDHVSETHNRFVDWTKDQISELQAENRALMSEALRRTEGKG